jgi:hypothetical protein
VTATKKDRTSDGAAETRGSAAPGALARGVIAGMIVCLAFFSAFGYAMLRASHGAEGGTGRSGGTARAAVTGPTVTGPAAIAVTSSDQRAPQSVTVNVSKGYFDPSVVRVRAGVPVRLSFGRGSGCMSEVLIEEFGVRRDLTRSGAVVELPALPPGEYAFSCGMGMAHGSIVAR